MKNEDILMFPCPVCKKFIETKVKQVISKKKVTCSACHAEATFSGAMVSRYKLAAEELIKAESAYEKVLDELIADASVVKKGE
jgi:hypothetical protein